MNSRMCRPPDGAIQMQRADCTKELGRFRGGLTFGRLVVLPSPMLTVDVRVAIVIVRRRSGAPCPFSGAARGSRRLPRTSPAAGS